MNLKEAKEKLTKYKQEHLLYYYDSLQAQEQEALLQQIEDTDFSVVTRLKGKEETKKTGKISPIAAMTLDEIRENADHFTETGLETIRAGKVGAVLLAGGMGTRLGSDNPKGMYDIGLTRPVYIFERIIRNLFEVVDVSKTWIHLFVMTSDKNHDTTTEFFKEHQYFGYDAAHIHFFKQDMAPASDYEGKVYLEEKGKLATSPNGNGGWFSS